MKNLITLGLIILTIPVNGQFNFPQTKDNTMVVKGTAILKQIPEILSASIVIKSESLDYSECQNNLLAKVEKVKTSLIKQNISNDIIKTNEFQISEKDEYQDGKTFQTGFKGSLSLIIETNYSPDLTKKLISAFKIDSVTLDYSIDFKLSEQQKSKLRQEAIKLSVEDAKEKAILLAKSSNVKLLKINSITYLDDELSWAQDRDIIKERTDYLSNVFLAVEVGQPENLSINFNPQEIGIIKSVQIDWVIEDNQK
jgi:uncharacterized protein